MPRLHQYKSRDNYYVLTSIRGAVVTFQLTPQGESKLRDAGIAPDQNFPRALLLDLYRAGDAFTHGTGVDQGAVDSLNQLELDFVGDPDPEASFPSCQDCTALSDLHLSLCRDGGLLVAKLQCPDCRDKASQLIDTCFPLALLSAVLLDRLFRIKDVVRKLDSVQRYEELLAAEYESKWDTIRKAHPAGQGSLFGSGLADTFQLVTPKSNIPR